MYMYVVVFLLLGSLNKVLRFNQLSQNIHTKYFTRIQLTKQSLSRMTRQVITVCETS